MSDPTERPTEPAPVPEAPSARPPDESPRPTAHAPLCDLCGAPMRESHCKLICDQCGYVRDCSDP